MTKALDGVMWIVAIGGLLFSAVDDLGGSRRPGSTWSNSRRSDSGRSG